VISQTSESVQKVVDDLSLVYVEEGIQIYGSVAITMGNVWVTGKDGKEVMVDKTWVFKKGKDGKLKIIVHKSALPFSPGK